MHKVLWDAVISCRIHRNMKNVDEQDAHCACCPLKDECGEIDKQEVRR